jgi:lipopolysaccharide export system protein LptA
LSPRFQFSRKLWLSAALLLAALAAAPPAASGQQTVMGRVKNFSVSPDYYDPPHQAQAKSLLQGAEAVPMAGGQQVQITQARLRTFREDGAEEMLVVAPECLYESRSRSVRSAGPLEVQTADGKFSLQGEGFSWQQTNSTLVISNQVRTRVHPSLLQRGEPSEAAAATAEEPPLEITSERFEYAREEGLGIYRGQVRVSGTNLAMSGGVLTIQMPVGGRRVQSITAEQQIAVEYSGVQASGEHAVYAADTGMVRVWGRPAWKTGQREGRAEELVIDPTNRVFLASGNGWMRLPGESLAGSGLLASGRKAAKRQPTSLSRLRANNTSCAPMGGLSPGGARHGGRVRRSPRHPDVCPNDVRFAGQRVEELLSDGGLRSRRKTGDSPRNAQCTTAPTESSS